MYIHIASCSLNYLFLTISELYDGSLLITDLLPKNYKKIKILNFACSKSAKKLWLIQFSTNQYPSFIVLYLSYDISDIKTKKNNYLINAKL